LSWGAFDPLKGKYWTKHTNFYGIEHFCVCLLGKRLFLYFKQLVLETKVVLWCNDGQKF